MIKQTLVGLTSLLVLTNYVYGSDSVNAGTKKTEIRTEDSEESDSSGSSESARGSKSGGIAFKTGLLVGGIPGAGVDGYFNMGSKLQLGISVSSGSLDLKDAINDTSITSNLDIADLKAQVVEVYAKYFVANSFAVIGGLAQRSIQSHILVSSNLGTDSIDLDVSGSALTAKVGLGNYWSWDSGFTLGCEWVGYLVPFTSSYKSNSTVTGLPNSDMTKVSQDAEDLGKIFARSSTAQLLNLVVGYSF